MGVVERLLGFALIRLAQGVVEVAGEDGFGYLGDLRDLAHVLEQVVEFLLLAFQLLLELPAFAVVGQGLAATFVEVFHPFADLFLGIGEVAGLGAHFAHLLSEFVGGFLAEILLQVLEILLGPGAGGEGLRGLALLQVLLGATDVLARLLELFARLGHFGAVPGFVHPLLELIQILAEALLLLAKALELLAELLLLLLGLGLLERGLDVLDALVEVLLPLGEFTKAVQDLELLASLGILLILVDSLALRLVALLLLLHLHLAELALLAALATAAALLPVALTVHLKLT